MTRFGSVVLGAGLVVLWIIGLNQGATMWLTWLLGLAGLTSIVVAAMLPAEHGREGAKPPALVGFFCSPSGSSPSRRARRRG